MAIKLSETAIKLPEEEKKEPAMSEAEKARVVGAVFNASEKHDIEALKIAKDTAELVGASAAYSQASADLLSRMSQSVQADALDALASESDPLKFEEALKRVEEVKNQQREIKPEIATDIARVANKVGVSDSPLEDLSLFRNKLNIAANALSMHRISEEASSDIDALDFFEQALGLTDIDNALAKPIVKLKEEFNVRINNAKMSKVPDEVDWLVREIEEMQFFDNPDAVKALAEIIISGTRGDAELEDTLTAGFAGLTVLGGALSTAKLFKSGKNFINNVKGLRQLRTQANEIAEASEQAANVMAEDIANAAVSGTEGVVATTDDILKTPLQMPAGKHYSNGLSAKVAAQVEANQRILAELERAPIEGVTQAQVEAAKKKAMKELESPSILQVKDLVNDFGDVTELEVLIGKKDGSSYLSEATAKNAMSRMGIKGEVTQLTDGGWAIKTKRVLPVEGESFKIVDKGANPIRQFFDNVDNFIDMNFLAIAREADLSRNRIVKAFADVWDDGVGKIGRKVGGKKKLARVSEILRERQADTYLADVEMSTDEFKMVFRNKHDRLPDDDEVKAFVTFKQLNDAAWMLLNRAEYTRKLRRGAKTGTFKIGDQDVRGAYTPLKSADEVSENAFIYDEDTGQIYSLMNGSGDGFISKNQLQEIVGERSVFEALDDTPVIGGTQPTFIISRKTAKDLDDLDMIQVGRKPNGRIGYTGRGVLKARRIRTAGDRFGNAKIKLRDAALFMAPTMKKGKDALQRVLSAQAAIKQLRNGEITKAEADEIIEGLGIHGANTTDDFVELLNRKGIDVDDELQLVKDGEETRDLSGQTFIRTTTTSSSRQRVQNRLLRGRTDERLTTIDGEALIADPILSMNKRLAVTADHVASTQAKQDLLDNFVKNFGHLYNKQAGDTVSNIEVLDSGIRDDAVAVWGRDVVAAAKGHERMLRRFFREKGVATQWIESKIDDLVDTLLEKGKDGAADAVEALGKNFIGSLKKYTFHVRLGMFNTATFLLQASQASAVIALDPVNGLKGAMDYWVMRSALFAKDPQAIKNYVRFLSKKGVIKDAAEMEEKILAFNRLGFNDYGNSIADIDAVNYVIAPSSRFGKFLDAGLTPFREGDRIVRMMAFSTAWSRVAKKVKNGERLSSGRILPRNVKPTNKDFEREVIKEANQLVFGITSSDVQTAFRGVAQLPGQFLSFPFRMIGALFNKNFTKAERARLFTSYLLMGGAAGTIPFYKDIEAKFFGGRDLDPTSGDVFLRNGIVDFMVHFATNGEMQSDFNQRVGVSVVIGDLFDKIVNNSIVSVALGPTGQGIETTYDAIKLLADEFKPLTNPDFARTKEFVTQASAALVTNQISSASKIYKLWYAANFGKAVSSKGRVLGDENVTSAFLKHIVGLGDGDVAAAFDFTLYKKHEREIIRKHADAVTSLMREKLTKNLTDSQKDAINKAIETHREIAVQAGLWDKVVDQVYNNLDDRDIKTETMRRFEEVEAIRRARGEE